MKKKVGIIKRVLCLCLVFLLSINSFAAIVSDNDGSAFITKAEFDALKNSFQTQIDTYNTSIDSKIDGAIAQYLSGIQLDNKEQISLPVGSWGKVTAMSQPLKPRFEYPGANLALTMVLANMTSDSWRRIMWAYVTYKRVQANSMSNYKWTSTRPTMTGSMVSESTAGDAVALCVWDGIKCNWEESILASKFAYLIGDIYAIEQPDTKMFLGYYLTSLTDGGYQADMDVYSYWKAGFSWYTAYASAGWTNFMGSSGSGQFSLTTSCEVASDADEALAGRNTINDPRRPYKHIIMWKNKNFELYNETFLHTMNYSNIDTLNSNNWINCTAATSGAAWSVEKDSWYSKMLDGGGGGRGQLTVNVSNNKYNNTANTTYTKIPRVGLAKPNTAASFIYQYDDPLIMSTGKTTFTLGHVNLLAGLPLFAAKKGDKITWNPKFKPIRCSNTSTPETYNVAMSFAIGGFTNGDGIMTSVYGATKLNLDYENASGIVKNQTVAITSNDSADNPNCKVTFVMPADGWVYVKWWPDIPASDIDNYNWEIDLDLANCGTIERTAA